MMEHVADENRAVAGAFQPEYHMTGRVSWRRNDVQELVESERPGDKISASAVDDRQHAFAECAELHRLGFIRISVELAVVLEVRLGDDVAGIRKCRHPAAVTQLCIPADVIVMEMRTHHVVDVLRPRASGGEAFEVGCIEHVPERPRRPRPVVAAAAVDENALAADLQQPAVHAELDEVLLGVIVMRRHPMGVLRGDPGVVFGENVARAVHRQISLLNTRDAGLADRKYRHLFPTFCSRTFSAKYSLIATVKTSQLFQVSVRGRTAWTLASEIAAPS